MSTYRQFIPDTQDSCCNIQYNVTREAAASIPACSLIEYSELLGRYEAEVADLPHDERERRNMAAGYLAGLIDPVAFVDRLGNERLTGPAAYMAEAFSLGVLIMAQRQNAAPVPPVSVRERNKAEERAA